MDVLEVPLLLVNNESEDVGFQDIVTQLLMSEHLKRVDRLGSSELVQLRKSFQETCGKCRFHEAKGEVRDLEADMRDLQVETEEGDDHCLVCYGEIKGGRNAATDVKGERLQVWEELQLETKLQLGDIEFDEENGECGANKGKRRPSCGVAISRFDLKRRRNDVVDIN